MTIERAKQLAKQRANGYVCSLREGEAEEYHKLCFSALRAQQEHEINVPLTLDELRQMDREPVYIHGNFPGDCGWKVIKMVDVLDIQFTDGDCFRFADYGKSWIAYRHKPEDDATK